MEQGVTGEHEEDRAPRGDQQDRLADVRGEHRNQHEDHEDEAHDPGHVFGLEQVADHGHDQHPGDRGRRAHRDPAGNQQREAAGEPAEQGEDAVEAIPAASTGLRPKRSDSGPQISWVEAKPMK